MIIVSDTSALGNLAIVDHLSLLQAIYNTVVIPDVVAQELSNATSPKSTLFLALNGFKFNPSQTKQWQMRCNKTAILIQENLMQLFWH
jgi:predicted nucleic acid-binding protein